MSELSVPLERRLPAGRAAGILPALISQCRGRLEASDAAAWKAALLRSPVTFGSTGRSELRSRL